MEAGYVIGMIIVVVLCWYIGQPVLFGGLARAGSAGSGGKALRDLALRKEEVMLTLKDLEMDFKMKKISEADYRALYSEAVHQGSLLVQQIETTKNAPETRRPAESPVKPTHKFCTHCGTARVAGAKFCGECGQQI